MAGPKQPRRAAGSKKAQDKKASTGKEMGDRKEVTDTQAQQKQQQKQQKQQQKQQKQQQKQGKAPKSPSKKGSRKQQKGSNKPSKQKALLTATPVLLGEDILLSYVMGEERCTESVCESE